MDTQELAALYRLTPPVVTWYLTTESAEDTEAQLEITWKNGLRELVDRGVDAATLDALTAARQTSGQPPGTRLIVAAGGEVHLDRRLSAPALPADLVVGPLPHLLPYLAWLGSRRPHLVVLTDREGADVVAYPATGGPAVYDVTTQTGEWPVHKTGTGGWAAKRFEATVEESWERSAERVATLVDDVARQVEPAVIVGSGDQRAISLLQEHLPVATREAFVTVAGGGRHADGGDDLLRERVAAAVAERAARDDLDVLERFAEARGRGEGAREGVDQPTQAPLVDVALRAAFGTDAKVLVVSGDAAPAPLDGLGALLRFDAEPT